MRITSKSIVILAAALMLVTQPGASCVSDTSSDGGSNYPRNDRYPPNDRDRDENNYEIPQRADIVREGRGNLAYTTDADGMIYVQNLRHEETILSRRVHRGQRIAVSPEENRIQIDGDTVSKSDLKRDDVHRIYLLRDRRFEDDRDRDSRDNDRAPRDSDRAPRGVPSQAQLMGEGRNKELSFRPSKTGSVYIYDTEDRRLVARISIRSGQKFVLSPGRSRATIEGKTVEQSVFNSHTTYRVYFNRED